MVDELNPWCCVNVDEDGYYIVGQWGYCSRRCEGETTTFESSHNIAREENLWSVQIFDFNSWRPGLCHTYNPPKEVAPRTQGQFYALFGNKGKVIEKYTLPL